MKYFSENKPALPKGWIVDTERPYNNCAAGIVEGSEVVSGRRSMMLQANNYACLLYNENGFTAKNPVKIQCRAKCSAGTEIFFAVCCKDPKGGTADQSFAMTSVKVIRDKETFTYSFVFDPQKYGVSDQSCFIRIYVWNGRMYLDDMSAVEIR